MNIAISVNNCKIRLTNERWEHIVTEHPELSDCYNKVLEIITLPISVFKGNNMELLAIGLFVNDKYIVVVYKETNKFDGFVITAFITSRMAYFNKREAIWKKM